MSNLPELLSLAAYTHKNTNNPIGLFVFLCVYAARESSSGRKYVGSEKIRRTCVVFGKH